MPLIFFARATLVVCQCPVVSRNAPQCLKKEKKKVFSSIFGSSFNVKMPSSSDETAIPAAFMLNSSAAAGIAVTSCISPLSSSEIFIGSLGQLPAYFVTNKRRCSVT